MPSHRYGIVVRALRTQRARLTNRRLEVGALVASILGAGYLAAGYLAPVPSTYPAPPSSTPIVKARLYGAVCDGAFHRRAGGASADWAAIEQAIRGAEALRWGAEVLLPRGHCVLSQSLTINSGAPIVLAGSTSSTGRYLTTLTDPVDPRYHGGDISVTSDGNTIRDLVLDQSRFGGALYVSANHTTVERSTILGGGRWYGVFFAALPSGAKAVGNQVLDTTAVSLIDRVVAGGRAKCDDGFVWANQKDSLISNLSFTGTRLAIYEDAYTTIDGYTYHPGPQRCDLDGFFITQPSNHISMQDLVMYGSGGIISNSGNRTSVSANISITGEKVEAPVAGAGFSLDGPSHPLDIRNVQDVTIGESNFDSGLRSNSGIIFRPTTHAEGVTVSGSVVPRVSLWGAVATPSAPAAPTVADFVDDTFPAFAWPVRLYDTFVNAWRAPLTLTIDGGTFLNSQPGDRPYMGLFHGVDTTLTVNHLAGYTGPTKVKIP